MIACQQPLQIYILKITIVSKLNNSDSYFHTKAVSKMLMEVHEMQKLYSKGTREL